MGQMPVAGENERSPLSAGGSGGGTDPIGPFSPPDEGAYVIVEAGGVNWIIARVGGRLYAVSNRCGHIPQPMDDGRLTGRIWRCPHHGVRYDITTGEVVDDHGFTDVDRLQSVPCLVREDGLYLDLGT